MGVMVYARLGEVLRAHHLTVDDLQRQIATRFGSAVDARTLGRLARDGRVRRPSIEIVAAATLDVGLADVLRIDARPLSHEGVVGADTSVDGEDDFLVPGQRQHLADPFDPRIRCPSRDDEGVESDAFAGAGSRRARVLRIGPAGLARP